jgi:hypothetical protein
MRISWRPIYYSAVRAQPLFKLPLANQTLVGYCLRNSVEQQGSLRFLSQVERVLGWRTSWIIQELEHQWAELAAFDSCGA